MSHVGGISAAEIGQLVTLPVYAMSNAWVIASACAPLTTNVYMAVSSRHTVSVRAHPHVGSVASAIATKPSVLVIWSITPSTSSKNRPICSGLTMIIVVEAT